MSPQEPDPIALAPPSSPEDGFPLLPPRPNLGPEPWSEPSGPGAWTIAVALAVALVLGLLAIAMRRRRGRRALAPGPSPIPGPARGSAGLSPADRLVARAEAIREALIAAFGPSWAARTTEEVADAPELADRLGPDRASRVVALLLEADRAKFAGGSPVEGPGEAEEIDGWVAEVGDALARPKASPR